MASTTSPYRAIISTVFILPLFMFVNVFICFKMYRKFRNNVEPVHVFLFNYFATQAIHLFSHEIILIFVYFSTPEAMCNEYFFSLFTSMICYLGIIAMQIDRFSAVFWAIHYKQSVTTRRAIIVVIINTVITASITIAARYIDTKYGTCTFPEILVYTRRQEQPTFYLMALQNFVQPDMW